eukprot:6195472-Pleurochrysis_carterae.AAC.3
MSGRGPIANARAEGGASVSASQARAEGERPSECSLREGRCSGVLSWFVDHANGAVTDGACLKDSVHHEEALASLSALRQSAASPLPLSA